MRNDFEKDVYIDPNALDVEWLRQASLTAKYAQKAAYAKDNLTRAKDKLDVVKAQLDGELRAGIAAGEKKPTEAAIASMVLQHPRYAEVNEAYLEAKLNADLCQAACTALENKKSALEALVRLLGMQYFAGPREPRDIAHVWGEQLQSTYTRMEAALDNQVKTRMNTSPYQVAAENVPVEAEPIPSFRRRR
jgi:hypothetical protein